MDPTSDRTHLRALSTAAEPSLHHCKSINEGSTSAESLDNAVALTTFPGHPGNRTDVFPQTPQIRLTFLVGSLGSNFCSVPSCHL